MEPTKEEEIPRKGKVGIVYVDNSLYPGRTPRVGWRYWINKAWSAEDIPTIGAQLQRLEGNLLVLCGWVRVKDYEHIMHHLNNNRYVRSLVVEKEPFVWDDDDCCWGHMEWEVVDIPADKSGKNANEAAGVNKGKN